MVDARGYLCPMPVVMVQNAIKKDQPGTLEEVDDNKQQDKTESKKPLPPTRRYWSITKLLSKTSNVSPHTAATRLRPAKTAMITA